VSHAADALGLSRGALYRRIENMGSEEPAGPGAGSGSRLTHVPLGRPGRRLSFERRLRLWLYLLGVPMAVLCWLLLRRYSVEPLEQGSFCWPWRWGGCLRSRFWWSRLFVRCRRWRMSWPRCGRMITPFGLVGGRGMMRWAIGARGESACEHVAGPARGGLWRRWRWWNG